MDRGVYQEPQWEYLQALKQLCDLSQQQTLRESITKYEIFISQNDSVLYELFSHP